MRRILDIVGTRVALFATVAWQLCIAPVWVSTPGSGTECEAAAATCVMMTCTQSPCRAATAELRSACIMNCRTDCEGRCERIEKDPGNKNEPIKRVLQLQAAPFVSPVLTAARNQPAPWFLDTPAQPDIDRIRTVVLIM